MSKKHPWMEENSDTLMTAGFIVLSILAIVLFHFFE